MKIDDSLLLYFIENISGYKKRTHLNENKQKNECLKVAADKFELLIRTISEKHRTFSLVSHPPHPQHNFKDRSSLT